MRSTTSSCDLPSALETRRVCLFIPDSVSALSLFRRPVSPGFPISRAMRTRAQVGTEGRKLGDRDRRPQAGACHASCARAQRSHLEGIRLQDRGPGPLGCGALRLQSLEGACPCLARPGPGQPQCDGQTLGTTASQEFRAELQACRPPAHLSALGPAGWRPGLGEMGPGRRTLVPHVFSKNHIRFS